MRNLTLFLFMLLSMQLIFAQAPKGIHYQAVLRDGNMIMANQSVDILLGILDANDNIIFEENHPGLTTDEFGTLNYVIGSGTLILGSFDQIDWDQEGLYFLSEATVNGVIYSLGEVPFQSVPYSLYSDYADSARAAGNLTIAGSTEGQLLIWDGAAWSANDGTTVMNDTISTGTVEGASWSATEDAAGDGKIETHAPNGSLNVEIRGYAANRETGYIGLFDPSGSERVEIQGGFDPTGAGNAGGLRTFGPNGSPNVSLFTSTVDGNGGGVRVMDDQGDLMVDLLVAQPSAAGEVNTLGPAGSINTSVGSAVDGDVGEIGIFNNATSNSKISMSGYGQFFVDNPLGNTSVRVSNGYFVNTVNHGLVEVYDSTGSAQAGVYVDGNGDGIVYGDIKNFRIPHPKQAGKEIWYASLEGPEAGAYVRGTAQLVNGEANVSFPEHFAAIANSQTMTVVLTPLSASSEGMAVIEKTAEGFRVKELRQGTGNYQFDWEVKCVRSGYENYRPVRDASEFQPVDQR